MAIRFDVMTLFPALVDTVLSESIIGRARKAGAIEVHAHNIRDYSEDKHRRVDDTPYGGGKGMLMAAPPVYNCWEAVVNEIRKDRPEAKPHLPQCMRGSHRLSTHSPRSTALHRQFRREHADQFPHNDRKAKPGNRTGTIPPQPFA